MMWGGDMMGWGGGWGWFGLVHTVLWWLLIVLAIVLLAKWVFGTVPGRSTPAQRALEILAERYARGEIDRKEFEEKKRDMAT